MNHSVSIDSFWWFISQPYHSLNSVLVSYSYLFVYLLLHITANDISKMIFIYPPSGGGWSNCWKHLFALLRISLPLLWQPKLVHRREFVAAIWSISILTSLKPFSSHIWHQSINSDIPLTWAASTCTVYATYLVCFHFERHATLNRTRLATICFSVSHHILNIYNLRISYHSLNRLYTWNLLRFYYYCIYIVGIYSFKVIYCMYLKLKWYLYLLNVSKGVSFNGHDETWKMFGCWSNFRLLRFDIFN